ncbi:hypothetical protein C8R46DRAFT_633634 [Mycena filopes]|nr:hypothetical protein C8R46DRAFT_633634 [Mycena filopes]
MALLGGVVSGLLGGVGTKPTGGLLGGGIGLPSLPLSLPTLPSLPPLFPTPPASDSQSASASAASISPPPASASSAASASTPSAPPPSSPPSSTPTPSAPATSASALPEVSTGSNGQVYTVSNIILETASSSSTPTSAPHSESFLQNKALSGSVFGVLGLLVLVLIVVLVTFVFRRRRRNRLLDDAVSFDPRLLAAADRYDGSEKGHSANPSLGTLGSSAQPAQGYGTTYSAEPFQFYGGAQPAYYGASQPPQQHPGFYGAPQAPQQQAEYPGASQAYYSPYVPPMAAEPTPASLSPAPVTQHRAQHSIPRIPVPVDLPEEFGSSEESHSVESPKTLKVTN